MSRNKRGRKAKAIPSIVWQIAINGTVAQKVELLLTDPVTGEARYGAKGELVSKLLSEWLENVESRNCGLGRSK